MSYSINADNRKLVINHMIPKNCLLVKTHVGEVRPSYHKLPPESFTFGKYSGKDLEGASEVIRNWKYHQSSTTPKKEDSYLLSNTQSVSKGLSKGSEFSKYRKSIIGQMNRMKSKSSSLDKIKEIVHGTPLRPSTPIQAVINNFYGNLAQSEFEAKMVQKMRNRANEAVKTRKEIVENPNFVLRTEVDKNTGLKQVFKMKKFGKVRSRAKCWGDN
jgi:hypothetical protein